MHPIRPFRQIVLARALCCSQAKRYAAICTANTKEQESYVNKQEQLHEQIEQVRMRMLCPH